MYTNTVESLFNSSYVSRRNQDIQCAVQTEITFPALCFTPHKTASTTSGLPDTSCSLQGEASHFHTLSSSHICTIGGLNVYYFPQ